MARKETADNEVLEHFRPATVIVASAICDGW